MSSDGLKFFPLIIDRWLAGTRMMSFEAKGAYLELLIYLYESQGHVIKDVAHVSRILGGIHGNKTKRLWREIEGKFVRNQYGYTHRLVSELLRNGGRIKGLGGGAHVGAYVGGFTDSTSTSTSTSKEKEKKKKESAPNGSRCFIPPEVHEVETYAREKGHTIDAEQFVDFYASKGWMVGKTKMKDWKAAVRNWTRRNAPQHTSGTPRVWE